MLQYVASASYYKHVFADDLMGNYGAIFNLFLVVIKGLLNIVVVVMGVLALVNADVNDRDSAYSLFRYMYVMAYVVGFPISVFSMVINARYFFTSATTGLTIISQHLFTITFIVLLLICKPKKQVPGVNLQDYDMAAFTSTGHRFLHYLLDSLFLSPALMGMGSVVYVATRFYYGGIIPLLILFLVLLNFFLYYFLSEVIFRQTFGKIVTKSCVATNGIEFSNGRMFLRTFCRFIPFDRFSFLFGANWHDKVSATAVVYVDSWENAFKDKENSEQA